MCKLMGGGGTQHTSETTEDFELLSVALIKSRDKPTAGPYAMCVLKPRAVETSAKQTKC